MSLSLSLTLVMCSTLASSPQAFAGLLNGGAQSRDSRVRGAGFSGAVVDELWAADGYEGSDKGSAASVFKQWKVRVTGVAHFPEITRRLA